MSEWHRYHEQTKANPPRPLLLTTLETIRVSDERLTAKRAIDLGCGAGQDTRELLRQGWDVLAIDQSTAAVQLLESSALVTDSGRLKTRAQAFEDIQSLPRANLVYASMSLPFCRAEVFPALWQEILRALDPHGWVAADFFGPEDDWVKASQADGYPVQGHSREDLDHLFEDFTMFQCKEKREKGCSSLKQEKFWHVFSVVAQKNK